MTKRDGNEFPIVARKALVCFLDSLLLIDYGIATGSNLTLDFEEERGLDPAPVSPGTQGLAWTSLFPIP